MIKQKETIGKCEWIGSAKEGCCQSVVLGKSYCIMHYRRIYDTYLPEMADYIIEKEVDSVPEDID